MANSKSHPAYGELSPSQSTALAKLQDLCQQHAVFWPTSTIADRSSGKGDNDPFTLLYAEYKVGGARVPSWIGTLLTGYRRYLRARKFDPNAAFKKYAASAAWRREIDLEGTYDSVDVENFETIRRLVSLGRLLNESCLSRKSNLSGPAVKIHRECR